MEKKSNTLLVWPALLLIILVCPGLVLFGYNDWGYIAGFIGLILLIYALATGQLKLFG